MPELTIESRRVMELRHNHRLHIRYFLGEGFMAGDTLELPDDFSAYPIDNIDVYIDQKLLALVGAGLRREEGEAAERYDWSDSSHIEFMYDHSGRCLLDVIIVKREEASCSR